MKNLSKDVLVSGVAKFIDTEILPKMKGDFLRFMAGGYVGTRLSIDLSRWYDENRESMCRYGIVDQDGNLDMDFLENFMKSGFEVQPVLKVEPAMFLPSDSLLLMVLPAHIDFTQRDQKRLFEIFNYLTSGTEEKAEE